MGLGSPLEATIRVHRRIIVARIIDCPCGHAFKGADDGELFTLAHKHVAEDHPEMKRTDDEVRARVAADARAA